MVVVEPGTLGFCEGAVSVKVKPEYLTSVWEHVSTRLLRTHYASLTVGAFNIVVRIWGESPRALERLVEDEVKRLTGVIDYRLMVFEEVAMGRWRRS